MMLPVETFAEVVSFLGYYDLGGLKLTSKLTSAVANHCADGIRLFDFAFYIHGRRITVYRLNSDGRISPLCQLELSSEKHLAEFLFDSFRNCTVGRFYLGTGREYVQNAIKLVAKTVVVAGKLEISVKDFENEQKLFEYVDSFRRVQSLTIWPSSRLIEMETLKNLCQRKNIALDL